MPGLQYISKQEKASCLKIFMLNATAVVLIHLHVDEKPERKQRGKKKIIHSHHIQIPTRIQDFLLHSLTLCFLVGSKGLLDAGKPIEIVSHALLSFQICWKEGTRK